MWSVADNLAHDFARHVADFALQIAHAGFARVVLDQRRKAVVLELDLLVGQARRFHLLLHQKALGDFQLFELRITGKPDHFHAVLQRRRNGVQHVGRRDEEDLREIVFHVEVMIDEHVVLLGIEHFEQRRRRVAAEIGRHLVDFVQHEDRIARPGLLHHLDDLAGQRADVSPAMAADFGFIAHAAERHADELAAGGLRDRHAKRSLADARRSDEQQNRTLRILHHAAHGEEFENALFDFFEPVVIGFEHFLGELQLADFLRLLLPRHREQPVEVVARNGGFGRHRRHVFEPLQFGHRLFEPVLRHAGHLDALLQLIDFALLAAAQFLLDGLDLFVEVILFLRLLHLALHAALDGAVDIELLDFDIEHLGDARQAVDGIEDFEQFLLLFDGELQIGADGVGQFAGIVHADGRDHRFVVQVLAELDVLLEQRRDAAW